MPIAPEKSDKAKRVDPLPLIAGPTLEASRNIWHLPMTDRLAVVSTGRGLVMAAARRHR
jgi:hypothetical protein